ncbi:MAG: hypothetical protein ABH863_02825, partial [Candidatus Micrarchaeota archaeon]
KFNFLGLESADYDSLQFSVIKDLTLTTYEGTVFGDFIVVSSGLANAFHFSGRTVDEVYVAMNATGPTNQSSNGSNASTGRNGWVYYLDSNGVAVPGNYLLVYYYYRADKRASIFFNFISQNGVAIEVPEKISDLEGGTDFTHYSNWHLNLLYDKNLRQFVNILGNSQISRIGYSYGVEPLNYASKEPGYTTYRGTIFNSITPATASISYPVSIVHARYALTLGGDDVVRSGIGGAPAQK